MKILLLVFVAVWGASEALVCLPNVCDTVKCAAVENCDGKVKSGGFCGCCQTCMKQLGETESCFQNIFVGVPSTAECGEGLICGSDYKCVKPVVKRAAALTCADAHKAFLSKTQNGGMMIGAEEPKCETDGTYKPIQCLGSKCSCTSSDGKNLGYSVNRWDTKGMTCKCAIDLYNYLQTGLIGKMFHCGPKGNYLNYQCVGSVCWCRDASGNNVGSSVNIGQLASLNCQ